MREVHDGDRRTRRTRRLIGEALIALMLEKRYDRITVREIVERADVGRSTFYANFRDKEAVFVGEFERVLDLLHRRFAEDAGGQDTLLPSLALFHHVREQEALYRALVRGHGVETLYAAGQRHLAARIEQRLAALARDGATLELPPSLLAGHVTSTFFTLLRWWLDGGMAQSPEQMADYYERLTLPVIRAVVRGAPI